MERFPNLFEPVQIGKVQMKNRIAMAPMGVLNMLTPEGSPTQRVVDYYIERILGRVGLVITSLFKVENEIDILKPGIIPFVSHAIIAPLAEICETAHVFGTKVFVQLTAGIGRVASPGDGITAHGKPVSASATPNFYNPRITCREISTEEAEKIVKAFGSAAQIVKAAGADGIELHGHEGYIFDQFTTALWNRRTDKYGGDLRGRLTFPVEVLKAIKKMAGEDFPVIYRFGLKHYIKGFHGAILPGEKYPEAGRDIEEGLEKAKLLEAAGFDALHVDAGCYESMYWPHLPLYQDHGCMVGMAEKVKGVVKIPVLTVGRLEIPELAAKVIEGKKADMIVLGRGLLAEPHWAIKVREGRVEEIRPCTGCHYCCQRIVEGKALSCAVNPSCGRERLQKPVPAEPRKKILIAGGGVAGMEAARMAALRGHSVVLCEKETFLGGHLIEASVPDFKKDLERLNLWYKNQIGKLKVEVRFSTEVTPDLVHRESPDVVFVATGSKPAVPEVEGMEKQETATCIDLLLGSKKAGESVVIIGGGLIGCETALWLAKQGKKVKIMEALPEILSGTPVVWLGNKMMLTDLLVFHKVEIMTRTSVQKMTPQGVIAIDKEFKAKEITADTVAFALGLKPDDRLYESLKDQVPHVFPIGDCKQARDIMNAIWDGYEVGRLI